MKKGLIIYKKKIYYSSFLVNMIKLITPLILFFIRVKIRSIKGKIPEKGPLLIAAHHEEIADPFIIRFPIKRRLFWVADATLPRLGILPVDMLLIRWFMSKLGAVLIDKTNTKRNINLFNYLHYLLKRGEAIVFFPEAYLKSERQGKKFGEFKTGVLQLALKHKKWFDKSIPIFPIGLNYEGGSIIKNADLKIGNAFFVKDIKDGTRLFNEIRRLS